MSANLYVQHIWEKGQQIAGLDPSLWRQDVFGSIINRGDYGKRNSHYGWEIDHITPTSQGGADTWLNARPLNWLNNASGSRGWADSALFRSRRV